MERLDWADLVLFLVDGSKENPDIERIISHVHSKNSNLILIKNKVDQGIKLNNSLSNIGTQIEISVKDSTNIDELRKLIFSNANSASTRLGESNYILTTARQKEHLSLIHI